MPNAKASRSTGMPRTFLTIIFYEGDDTLMPLYDFGLLLFVAPAMILGMVAQGWIRSAYSRASRVPARMSGARAAEYILSANGMAGMPIEQVPGQLSDHYDPRHKVIRLSEAVYHGQSLAALGIAAHEVGHAIQDHQRYAPLVLRNLAVPMASIGSNGAILLMIIGVAMSQLSFLAVVGILLYGGVVVFQLINLPVEYNASTRAKRQLVELGLISQEELPYVSKVLHAAALTYVAATLQAILTILYFVMRFLGGGRRD